jgi:hypothetical protein
MLIIILKYNFVTKVNQRQTFFLLFELYGIYRGIIYENKLR